LCGDFSIINEPKLGSEAARKRYHKGVAGILFATALGVPLNFIPRLKIAFGFYFK